MITILLNHKKLYTYLTYAGAIPFVICATCLIFSIKELPLLGSIEKIMSVYTLVIVTFLAGVHWGQHLNIKGVWSHYLPMISNIIAVALWLSFLVLSFKLLIIIFIVAFAILLLIDQQLFRSALITREYFKIRCFVTAIVILTLIFSGITT